MIEFVWFLILFTGTVGLSIILLMSIQYGLKRVYATLTPSDQDRYRIMKNVYEADSWQLFGVCILIGLLVWWLI